MKETLYKSILNNSFSSRTAATVWQIINGIYAAIRNAIRFQHVNKGSNVKIIGGRAIDIGKNSSLGSRSWLNVNHKMNGCALRIGNNCFIGQDNFITVGHKVEIEDYFLSARNCRLLGATHNYKDPLSPYLFTGTSNYDTIHVGANCFLAANVTVVGNVNIGHGSIIGANAVVRSDIPPYSLAVGDPARPIKRFDFKLHAWVNWPHPDYTEGPDADEYVQALKSKTGKYPILPIAAANTLLANTF